MRTMIQRIGVCVGIVLTFPFAAVARLEYALFYRDEWFKGFAQMLSLFPGRSGSYLRLGFYKQTLSACAWQASIQMYTKFTHPEGSIGENAYIGMHCTIGRAHIGADTLVADYVQILSGRHHHGSSDSWREKGESGSLNMISVGAKSWIGASAIVMADVGEQCVIGAGTVLTKPAPAGSLVVGNPGREVKRDQANQAATS
jgi:acetyltransferase-like isoleucine patch superfamily enzyme